MNRETNDRVDDSHALTQEEALTILAHLDCELEMLEHIIGTSNQMKTILSCRPGEVDSEVDIRNESTERKTLASQHESLQDLRKDLKDYSRERFPSVMEGRKQMLSILKSLNQRRRKSDSGRPNFVGMAPPEIREKLRNNRKEIRKKVDQVRALNAGNQAVLAYTFDYYENLLMGIMGESNNTKSYQSNGSVSPPVSGIVQTKC